MSSESQAALKGSLECLAVYPSLTARQCLSLNPTPWGVLAPKSCSPLMLVWTLCCTSIDVFQEVLLHICALNSTWCWFCAESVGNGNRLQEKIVLGLCSVYSQLCLIHRGWYTFLQNSLSQVRAFDHVTGVTITEQWMTRPASHTLHAFMTNGLQAGERSHCPWMNSVWTDSLPHTKVNKKSGDGG